MIKLFETFNEYNQVKSWLDTMLIRDYTINDDLTVDVNGDVDISFINLTEIPIQFGRVTGSFYCSNNKLTNLKGCPIYLDVLFCGGNNLTTLKYFPQEFKSVGCSNNPLPKEIFLLNSHSIWKFFKHQEEYGIWNNDESFNQGRFDLFKKDYEKGILNDD